MKQGAAGSVIEGRDRSGGADRVQRVGKMKSGGRVGAGTLEARNTTRVHATQFR